MFKKLLIVGGLVAVFGFFRWGSRLPAKAEEVGNKVVAWVDKKVKAREGAERPESKLLALRSRLKDIDVEISSTKDRLAQQIVDHNRVAAEASRLRGEVDTGIKVLTARAKEIDEASGLVTVNYNGSPVSVSSARKRLERETEVIAAKKALLAETETAASQREEGVLVLKKHVEELETLKLEAVTKLDRLDLELKSLRMQEVKDRFEANDTKAGQFLDSLKELEKDIEVKKVRRSLDPEKSNIATPETNDKPTESASDAVARKLGLKTDKKIEKSGD